MAVRPVLRLGDPRLRQRSQPVADVHDPALQRCRPGGPQTVDRSVEGFHARVVQHECNHLDGVLFPDRLSDPTAFGFIPELEAAGLIAAVSG
jgi:peptide deformylase